MFSSAVSVIDLLLSHQPAYPLDKLTNATFVQVYILPHNKE